MCDLFAVIADEVNDQFSNSYILLLSFVMWNSMVKKQTYVKYFLIYSKFEKDQLEKLLEVALLCFLQRNNFYVLNWRAKP